MKSKAIILTDKQLRLITTKFDRKSLRHKFDCGSTS